MGGLMSNLCATLSTKKEHRVLFMGLDFAGKTTVLYQLKLGKVVTTIPTIGYNVEDIQHNNLTLTCWDVGGRDQGRALWRHYYQNTEAIIFVIDSNDRERICDKNENGNTSDNTIDASKQFNSSVKTEIKYLISEPELKDVVLLIFANKQDLPNAMSVQEITDILELNKINNRKWHVQASCAKTGDGLQDGLDWLSQTIKSAK